MRFLPLIPIRKKRYLKSEMLRHGKTNVIIAHRISTLQNADKIIVVDGSRIIEEGNHEELVAQGGMYADLYRRQLLER